MDAATRDAGFFSESLASRDPELFGSITDELHRQQDEIDKLKRHEATRLPDDFDYEQVEGLSNEIRQKLIETRPETLAQAGRISGVTPAAVSILLIHLKKRRLLDDTRVANG